MRRPRPGSYQALRRAAEDMGRRVYDERQKAGAETIDITMDCRLSAGEIIEHGGTWWRIGYSEYDECQGPLPIYHCVAATQQEIDRRKAEIAQIEAERSRPLTDEEFWR